MGLRQSAGRARARRVGDDPTTRLAVLVRRVRDMETGADGLSPVLAGQVLLVASGVPVGAASPLLRPDARSWTALGAVSAVMLLALLMSPFLPWHRLPSRATLVFPALVCAALVSLEELSHGLAAPLTAVLVLCFAYVGLAHPPWTSLLLFPLAAGTFITVNGGLSRVTSVRLVLLSLVWVVLAELLARQASRQRLLSQALRAAAHTDVLTGVGNRREVDLRLAGSEPGDTVVLFDLDHFKALNDTYGHQAGDRVLADFGALLRSQLRSEDFAGRFGGEEFVLVLPAASEEATRAVLGRLRTSWAEQHPGVTFSSGRARCRHGRDVYDTVASADRQLYRAKADGRDTDRAEHPVALLAAV